MLKANFRYISLDKVSISMGPQFFDLLVNSSREVFETMSFIDVAQLPPLEENSAIEDMEITAVVALAGEISGMLAIHCRRDFACECSQLISGDETGEFSDEILLDTAGELANMIAGTLKRRMSSHVDLFDISVPCLFLSDRHRLFFKGCKETFPRLIVPFQVEGETRFYVDLLYHKR